MAGFANEDADWRALWHKMLTDDLVANLCQTYKPNTSIHSLKAKMLLKVTFAELRDRILEASSANKILEEERVKNEVLQVDNDSLQSEISQFKLRLKELEEENESLKDLKLKRQCEDKKLHEDKRRRLEIKNEPASFFAPETNFDMDMTLPETPPPKLSVPESLSQEEFQLKTPIKKEQEDSSSLAHSPIFTARRCSSSMSSTVSSPAPFSPHNSQESTVVRNKSPRAKENKKMSKLSLKNPPKKLSICPDSSGTDLEKTYFDDEQFKLFDSPETVKQSKQTKKEEEKEEQFGFYRGEIVRKKEERKKLPGWECHECQKFYEVFCEDMGTQEKQKLINKCSKHRQVQPVMGNTPEGFWEFGILQSPKPGKTQTGKLNTKRTKGNRLIDKAQAVSLEEDLDWA